MGQPAQLRGRLRQLPAIDASRLWAVQAQAIAALEASLARADRRALIQMATGSGKTFTAVNIAYRLLKFGGARRILFLVDRGNLGKQAEDEFANFEPPDDPRKFPALYTVQRLKSNAVNPAANVVITTIQRLYSMLKGRGRVRRRQRGRVRLRQCQALAGRTTGGGLQHGHSARVLRRRDRR